MQDAVHPQVDQREDLDLPRRAHLQDRVGVLADRVQWVEFAPQREALETTIKGLWAKLEVES